MHLLKHRSSRSLRLQVQEIKHRSRFFGLPPVNAAGIVAETI
jgi:hypothetical protein